MCTEAISCNFCKLHQKNISNYLDIISKTLDIFVLPNNDYIIHLGNFHAEWNEVPMVKQPTCFKIPEKRCFKNHDNSKVSLQ